MASPQGFWCWTWIAASTVDALAREAAAARRQPSEDPELADTQKKRKAKVLEKEEEKGEEKQDLKTEVASGSSGANFKSWWDDDWDAWGKWQDEQNKWKPEASKGELGKAVGKTRRPLPLPVLKDGTKRRHGSTWVCEMAEVVD